MNIPCRVKNYPKTHKILRGVGLLDASSIDAIIIGSLDLLMCFMQAKAYVKLFSSGVINLSINLKYLPDKEYPVKHYLTWYSLSLIEEEFLFEKSKSLMRQLIYDSRPYQSKYGGIFYSMAWFGGKDGIQYSQVIYPTVWTEILHELCHGWYSYFDLPDNTHKYLYEINDNIQTTAEEAFKKIFKELLEVWPKKSKLPLLIHISAPKL